MTLSRVPIKAALKTADHNYRRFDDNRDADLRRDRINLMAANDMPIADIADKLDLSITHVRRIKNGQFEVSTPQPVARPDLSDEHCWQLEGTVDTALELACRLRDEDPQIVWDALSALDRRELQEFAVIALAGLPIDHTKQQLFGWVYDLAAGNEVA